MPKVITDNERISEVLERGVEKIYPDKKQLKELLLSGKKIRLYCGFDPSSPSLHIGNAIQINKLAQFQALGHEVIFLIGDFTGMIGDPTDKDSVRKKITREEAVNNSQNYQQQAGAYLNFEGNNSAQIMYNSEWHDKMNFAELIELSSNFTVQQMIQRGMFQERLKQEKPIYLHEFLYPLAQAYDSVSMNVDLEVGGNDQMFNMLAGRDLMKALSKKDKSVMTLRLLADAHGDKMGKTTGNALFLDTDPNNMYGILMSWPDEVIGLTFELCTKLPWLEVKEIQKQLKDNSVNPRDLKMKLAFEITNIVHGQDKANQAQEYFKSTVQNKEAPDDVCEVKADKGTTILDAVIKAMDGQKSNNDIRRLFDQGGVTVDNKKITDVKAEVQEGIYKVGKRNWFKVKIN
ncbi:MAG: tyrosine--tRNA ligase [bacterium]